MSMIYDLLMNVYYNGGDGGDSYTLSNITKGHNIIHMKRNTYIRFLLFTLDVLGTVIVI